MPDRDLHADQNLTSHRRTGTIQITAAGLVLTTGLLVFGISSLPEGPALAGSDAGVHASVASVIPVEGLDPAHAAINTALQLLKSEIVILDLPEEPGAMFDVVTAIGGQPVTLAMWLHSVRAPGFRVLAQMDDGSLVEVDPGPERTLRGRVVEAPEVSIAGSLLETGLVAMILTPEGDEFWIEPLAAHLPEGTFEPGAHVVFEKANAVGEPGVCGVTNEMVELHGLRGLDDGQGGSEGGVAGGPVCVNIAIDADFQYYQQYGSSVTTVTNQVTNIVNTANNQYENQVGIRHVITEIVIRTSSASNPYTSNNSSTLLNQFQSTWNSQPEWSIDRNVAHLFTGRNLNGGVIGIAYLNSMCIKTQAYGISQNLSGAFFWKTDLFAHEVGHNWNAGHCSCNTTTMHPSLTGANTFIGPGSNSVNQITNKKNSVSCTTSCTPPPPVNDDCGTAITVSVGDTPFTNKDATTSGFAESICNFDGSFQIPSDVWFRHTATCTGTLHVSTCNSTSGFDTKIAVYGQSCPSATGAALACNKDSCGQLSEVELDVMQGSTYHIRVGGHNGAQGEAVLSIECVPPPPPANNTCQTAIPVPMGDTPFTNVHATSTGFAESLCNFDGSFQIPSDVWFLHTAECTGTLHVSTCNSTPGFDTKIALYGATCPSGTGAALACNKDACGQLSTIEAPVEEGQVYRIRVGGHDGAQGDGTLTVDCFPDDDPPPPACPADLTGSGSVGVPDLLELLSAWGSCPAPCPADLTGSGSVGVPDLLELLSAWGHCP